MQLSHEVTAVVGHHDADLTVCGRPRQRGIDVRLELVQPFTGARRDEHPRQAVQHQPLGFVDEITLVERDDLGDRLSIDLCDDVTHVLYCAAGSVRSVDHVHDDIGVGHFLEGRPERLDELVRNLPHQLVEAFRSTFEEVADSDVIVHVVDGSHPDPAAQLRTVRDVIAEVDAQAIPEIVAFNKCDLIDETQRLVLHGLAPDAVFVSARTGEGLDELKARIDAALPVPDREVSVVVPYDRGDLVAELHERNRVLSTDYVERGTLIRAYVSGETLAKLGPFLAP